VGGVGGSGCAAPTRVFWLPDHPEEAQRESNDTARSPTTLSDAAGAFYLCRAVLNKSPTVPTAHRVPSSEDASSTNVTSCPLSISGRAPQHSPFIVLEDSTTTPAAAATQNQTADFR
jgi:hypothetical protein